MQYNVISGVWRPGHTCSHLLRQAQGESFVPISSQLLKVEWPQGGSWKQGRVGVFPPGKLVPLLEPLEKSFFLSGVQGVKMWIWRFRVVFSGKLGLREWCLLTERRIWVRYKSKVHEHFIPLSLRLDTHLPHCLVRWASEVHHPPLLLCWGSAGSSYISNTCTEQRPTASSIVWRSLRAQSCIFHMKPNAVLGT